MIHSLRTPGEVQNSRRARPAFLRIWSQQALGALLAIPLVVITLMIEEVAEREGFSWDGPIIGTIRRLDNPILDVILTVLTTIGGGLGLLLILVPLMTWCLVRSRFVSAIFLAVSVLGARAVGIILKNILDRPRPSTPDFDSLASQLEVFSLVLLVIAACSVVLWKKRGRIRAAIPFVALMVAPVVASVVMMKVHFPGMGDHSFPSGHAVTSMALAASVSFLDWPPRIRWWVRGGAALFVLVVGLSRVYFGLHYPSDVIGGWCVSLLWVSVVWTLLEPWRQVLDRSDVLAVRPAA